MKRSSVVQLVWAFAMVMDFLATPPVLVVGDVVGDVASEVC
jgi:hypothetical protein